MNKRLFLLLTALIVTLALGALAVTAVAEPQDNAAADKPDPKIETKKCLACHGPFDELAKSTAGYTTPSEEQTTPHKYVPHDDPVEANISNCTNCHTPHPIPPDSSKSAAKPTVEWCYTNCHHAFNLSPCSDCH
jgi:hypothetical protein